MSFASFIEKRRAQKDFNARLGLVLKAVARQEDAGCAALRADPLYSKASERKLLRQAIAADNAKAFAAVFEGVEKKDYAFVKSYPGIHPRGSMVVEKEYILHAAIEAGSRNVALFLARHPGVNKALGAGVVTDLTPGYASRGRQLNNSGSVAGFARAKGMDDVAEMIERRIQSYRPPRGHGPAAA